ncbi:Anaphase-promoting complex subunit 7 [Diplonema papillatum]|nr:Anaphase-promoting complex subunit 7 [Diplonema papillatum]
MLQPGSPLEAIKGLIKEGQHGSAVQLCSLMLGVCKPADSVAYIVETGNALLAQRLYRRALLSYRQAEERYKAARLSSDEQSFNISGSPPRTPPRSGFGLPPPQALLTDSTNANRDVSMHPSEKSSSPAPANSPPPPAGGQVAAPVLSNGVPVFLKERLAACCFEIGTDSMLKDAITHLTSINPSHRSVQTQMQLAQLYRCRGCAKLAADQYYEVIQRNKYCMEAITAYLETLRVALAQERGGGREWHAAVEKLKSNYELGTSPLDSVVRQWLKVQYNKLAAKPQQAVVAAREMRCPNNIHVISDIAECYYRMSRPAEALALFKKVRTLDPYYTGGMDIYSTLLRYLGNIRELKRLAAEMLEFAPDAPETWICASVAKTATSDPHSTDTPIEYALKATQRGPCFHRSYLLIASNLVAAGQTGSAIKYYIKAMSMSRDVPSYQGIVRAYVKDKNGRAALSCAKEATHLFPESASACALIGQVYHGLLKTKLARQHYNEALALDSNCTDALLPLCDLDCEEGKATRGIDRLKAEVPTEQILLKLASIYISLHETANAHVSYQEALQLNPNSMRAKEGLRLLSESQGEA